MTEEITKSASCFGSAEETDTVKLPVMYLEDPIKSMDDKRQYRSIRLGNGVRVLLISDPSTVKERKDTDIREANLTNENSSKDDALISVDKSDKPLISYSSAVKESEDKDVSEANLTNDNSSKDNALLSVDKSGSPESSSVQQNISEKMVECGFNIGVSNCNDPVEIPGVTRFIQHLFFVGDNYAQHFGDLVNDCGGQYNAYTNATQTVFNFTVPEKILPNVCDRLSSFFNQEHIEYQIEPARQLHGHIIIPDCVDKCDLRTAVKKLFDSSYVPNNVAVVLKANLPLAVLENYATQYFSKLSGKCVKPMHYGSAAELLNMSTTQKWYSIEDEFCTKMEFSWEIPTSYESVGCKPLQYLSWMFEHEGKNSLFTNLNESLEKFPNCEITTNITKTRANRVHFTLALDKLGETPNHDVIAQVVFSFINFMRREGPQKRIHDDIQKFRTEKFRCGNDSGTIGVSKICGNILFNPSTSYLTGDYICSEYDPAAIKAYMDQLTPENVNVVVYVEDLIGSEQFVESTDIGYTESQISPIIIAGWKEIQPSLKINLSE